MARTQSAIVLRRLSRSHPGVPVELIALESEGDRVRTAGSSPDFTGVFEQMLARGRIDAAVHSAKDLPARTALPFAIAAYPARADPRDALVVRRGLSARELPRRARVGSSSLRRRAQLLRWRPDLRVVEVRGNVDTRLSRVERGELDAVIVAAAGLARLGRRGEIGCVLPLRRFLPAPGQGALAVEIRRGDHRSRRLLGSLDDPATRACVTAERELAAALGGDCNLPLGALARMGTGGLVLRAEVLSPDGRTSLAACSRAPRRHARRLARAVGRSLLRAGAGRLLEGARR